MPDLKLAPERTTSLLQSKTSGVLTIVCLVVLGMNLRPALSSVAPILAAIQNDLQISSAAGGVLTTLPVLCFGLFAPGATWLASRLTDDRAILYGTLILVAGLCLRIFFGASGMFAGTLLAGAGIGIVMVLLPPVVKREFPHRAGFMMGLYTMAVCLGAAFAAGVTVPLQDLAQGNWRLALAVWAIPAALSAWLWHYRIRTRPVADTQRRRKVFGIHRNGLAWQVTLYMGLQSAIAFIVFGWLPSILLERGMAPRACGYIMSLIFACQIFSTLSAPSLASRGKDQRFMASFFIIITAIGVVGCLFVPLEGIGIWIAGAIAGLGMGGSFAIALALIVWRAANPEVAGSLSSMVQGIGYAIAALGPLAVGILREWIGDWSFMSALMLAIAAATLISGLGAGRNLLIHDEGPERT